MILRASGIGFALRIIAGVAVAGDRADNSAFFAVSGAFTVSDQPRSAMPSAVICHSQTLRP